MPSLVDEVKEKNDIIEVVSGYVKITPAGSNFKGLCPFHREKTPSFMVSREKQIFHCFGCSKGGDVITFIQEIEGLDFKESLKVLAEKAGIDYRLYQRNFHPGALNQKDMVREILEKTTVFFEENLVSAQGKKAIEYLRGRTVSEESQKNFRLGFAPNSFNALFDYLKRSGFTEKEIVESGSVYKKDNQNVYVDRFRNRLVFPITDSLNRVVGFSARVLPGDDGSQGKYINTPQTTYYDKGALLYGFFQAKKAIRESGEAILLEGNLDVVLSHQAGIKQAVATCGTALGSKQLKLLRRYVSKLTLAFDADMAGIKATKRAAELAWEEEFDVKVIPIEKGKDVADLVENNPEDWLGMNKKKKSLAGFFYNLSFKNRTLSLDQKKILTDKLLKLFSNIPSTVEKAYYVKRLAEKVAVPENYLWEKITLLTNKEERKNFYRKDEPAMTAPKNKGRQLLLEERIVAFIYAFPRLYFTHFEEIESFQFENPEINQLLEEMKIFLSGFGEIEGKDLKTDSFIFSTRNLNLKAKELLITLEAEMGSVFFEDPEKVDKEFLANIKLLGREMLIQRKNELLKEIKMAETKNQKKEMAALMDQLEKISARIIS